MSALAVFSYVGQDVRTVSIDGQPWFVLADIAKILGLTNPTAAAGSVDVDDLSTAEVIDSMGRTQRARITNESGMYSLVFQSRKAEAKEFKHWVTSVVLPEIRQSGSFNATPPAELSRLDILTMALESEQRAITAEGQVAELAPRADAWDDLASAGGDFEVADAAKMLARAGIPTGRTRLFDSLAEFRWIYRGGDNKWRAYATAIDSGYLTERAQWHYHPRTQEKVLDAPQVRVTIKGLERLRQRLHIGALQAVSA